MFHCTNMEKYLIPSKGTTLKSTLELLDDKPLLLLPQPYCLGILGQSSAAFWSKETIVNNILQPFLEEQERFPDSIIASAEGQTSMLIEWWAIRQDISIQIYEANWAKLGKRARILRDARIVKEASHLLVFLGERSDTYETMAIRELKKGKIVYTINPKTHEIEQLVLEEDT
jgi:hypothetical protein